MNRLFMIMGLLLILMMPQAWGSTQYPNPNRQTIWNNFTDGIHTFGQSPLKARATKMRLHYQRAMARIKSINQAKRQARLNNNN